MYLVATPIGAPDDIGARAVRTLQTADVVVCEELREGRRLLKRLGIDREPVELNEHNEAETTGGLRLALQNGKSLALISDAGTPVFCDPGRLLVAAAHAIGAKVVPIPGPSSLMAALVVSGFPIDRFRFLGMAPVKPDARQRSFAALKHEPVTTVLLDAPYRLGAVLNDLLGQLGPKRQVVVACDLTLPTERLLRGPLGDVARQFRSAPFKAEFVIVIAGADSPAARSASTRRPRGR